MTDNGTNILLFASSTSEFLTSQAFAAPGPPGSLCWQRATASSCSMRSVSLGGCLVRGVQGRKRLDAGEEGKGG